MIFQPEFIESQHPRAPRGSQGGGRFVEKGGTSGPSEWEARAAKPFASGLLSLFKIPSEYRQFRSFNEAGDYGADHYAGHKAPWLDVAVDNLATSRATIDTALGNGERTRASQREEWETIDALDDVLKQAVVPESLVVHRLVDAETAHQFTGMKVGDKVNTTNFTQASLVPLEHPGMTALKILVDAGQPGLLTQYDDLILPRSGEMELLGRDRDALVFKWIGAVPEKIAAQQQQKIKDLETLHLLKEQGGFPNLKEAHEIAGNNPKYNCIAGSVGDDSKYWGPGESCYWPLPMPRSHEFHVEDIDELFVDIFHAQELKPTPENQKYEKGFVKLALFTVDDDFLRPGYPTHLARQLPSGQWQSKFGGNLLAEHGSDIRDMNNGRYGDVKKIYKLRETDWKDIKDYKPDNITLLNHNQRIAPDIEREILGREAARRTTEHIGKVTGKVNFIKTEDLPNETERDIIQTRMLPAIRMLGKKSGDAYKKDVIYTGRRGQWHAEVAAAQGIEGGDTDEHHFNGNLTTYERGFLDPATQTYYSARLLGVDAAELRDPDRISELRVPQADIRQGPMPSQSIVAVRGYREYRAANDTLEVLVNPTMRDVRSLRSQTGMTHIRVLRDQYRNIYVWRGNEAIHLAMLRSPTFSGVKFDPDENWYDNHIGENYNLTETGNIIDGPDLGPYSPEYFREGIKRGQENAAKAKPLESRADDIAARKFEKELKDKTRSAAEQVADELGFDKKHLKFREPTQEERAHAVGSRMGRLDGVFSPKTGDITIILGHSDPYNGTTQSTVAHEVEHSRFYKVYGTFLDHQVAAYGLADPDAPKFDKKAFDTIKPYLIKSNEKHKALAKEDGCSQYSKSFWTQRAIKAEHSDVQAINETLAEIARLEYQSKPAFQRQFPNAAAADTRKFSDVSKVWVDFYREVNRQYERLSR